MKSKLTLFALIVALLLVQSCGCIDSDDPKATLEIDILVLESGILDNDSPEPLPDVEVLLEIHYADEEKGDWVRVHEKRLRTDSDGRIVHRHDVTYIGLFEARCWCLGKIDMAAEDVEYLGNTYYFEIIFD